MLFQWEFISMYNLNMVTRCHYWCCSCNCSRRLIRDIFNWRQLNFKGVINYITIDCHNTLKELSYIKENFNFNFGQSESFILFSLVLFHLPSWIIVQSNGCFPSTILNSCPIRGDSPPPLPPLAQNSHFSTTPIIVVEVFIFFAIYVEFLYLLSTVNTLLTIGCPHLWYHIQSITIILYKAGFIVYCPPILRNNFLFVDLLYSLECQLSNVNLISSSQTFLTGGLFYIFYFSVQPLGLHLFLCPFDVCWLFLSSYLAFASASITLVSGVYPQVCKCGSLWFSKSDYTSKIS